MIEQWGHFFSMCLSYCTIFMPLVFVQCLGMSFAAMRFNQGFFEAHLRDVVFGQALSHHGEQDDDVGDGDVGTPKCICCGCKGG